MNWKEIFLSWNKCMSGLGGIGHGIRYLTEKEISGILEREQEEKERKGRGRKKGKGNKKGNELEKGKGRLGEFRVENKRRKREEFAGGSE